MTVVNETTAHLALPLPHPSNQLEDDVLRLRTTINGIDAKFALLDTLLASNDPSLDTLQELVTGIKAGVTALSAHVGAGAAVHAAATGAANGFMAAADKTKLDAVTFVALMDPFVATPTAGQTVFTVTGGYLPGSIMVFLNGVKLAADDYTATTSPTLTLAAGASTTDTLEVVRFKRALAA